MNSQDCTDAMTSTMSIVQTSIPERRPGKGIDDEARCVLGEGGESHANVTLEDTSEAFLFLIGRCSEVHRAGDVCRPFSILAAGVHKEHRLACYLGGRLVRSTVVHNGTMLAEAGDRVEGCVQEPRVGGTRGRHQFVDAHFGDRLASPNFGLQLGEGPRQGDAVFEVRFHHPCDLGLVLDGLHCCNWRRLVQPFGVFRRGILDALRAQGVAQLEVCAIPRHPDLLFLVCTEGADD
mmetsp:Transcript_71512/g.149532  ORF Transcript_71512/g.149532 Transcript_71512/m.149532 type:complete len:235 (+) Transcript_71512:620-1324(+)